jgi:DNA-binding LacI/PurR family transcriptional regulator
MAIGVILAARDFGLRVPDDLSVIGLDGHELGELFGLTTVDQDPRGQGAMAVRLLLEGLHGGVDRPVVDTEYPTNFIIRSSTAVPPPRG